MRVGLGDFNERGEFLNARRAPGRPEIDDDDFALEGFEGVAFIFNGFKGEIGGGFAFGLLGG